MTKTFVDAKAAREYAWTNGGIPVGRFVYYGEVGGKVTAPSSEAIKGHSTQKYIHHDW